MMFELVVHGCSLLEIRSSARRMPDQSWTDARLNVESKYMRDFNIKRIFLLIWLLWCGWWLFDGVRAFGSIEGGQLMMAQARERTMADVLVLMMSSFPIGTYAIGFLGDHLIEEGKAIDGMIGFLIFGGLAFASGYLQWFIVIPFLFKRICSWLRLIKG